MVKLKTTSKTSASDPATGWSFAWAGMDLADAALLNLTNKRTATSIDALATMQQGLPRSAFDHLQLALGIPQKQVAEIVMIPIRTLSRRQRLLQPESDRVLRVGMLFQRALEVLGEGEAARRWMQAPKKALGDTSPLVMARSELGARRVEQLLGQLEHGVFA